MNLLEAIKTRRSVYELEDALPISDDKLKQLIKDVLQYTPTAYHSQSPRIMLLLSKEHKKFWELTKDELRKIVPEKDFPKTERKINKFQNSYGTILYFDDRDVLQQLIEDHPLYADKFRRWKEQQNGMLQVNIWTLLSTYKIGASLQHYAKIVEERAKEEFDIPASWELIAQMPFGAIKEQPDTKEYQDIETRIIIKE